MEELRLRHITEQESCGSSDRYIVNRDLYEEEWEVYSTFKKLDEKGIEQKIACGGNLANTASPARSSLSKGTNSTTAI